MFAPHCVKADCLSKAALENVLQLSLFPRTVVAPGYLESATVDYGNWEYTDAPMNFVRIYDTDFLYANGLSCCTLYYIAGDPATDTPPDVNACQAPTGWKKKPS
jgi:hypothetical protein